MKTGTRIEGWKGRGGMEVAIYETEKGREALITDPKGDFGSGSSFRLGRFRARQFGPVFDDRGSAFVSPLFSNLT